MEKVFSPKLFSVLHKGYSKQMFQTDLMSGIIVGIVALPLAIAFAVASGVSPEKGLITAIVAGFIISFLGRTISSYTCTVGILTCEHEQTCVGQVLEAQFTRAYNFNNKLKHHKKNPKVN